MSKETDTTPDPGYNPITDFVNTSVKVHAEVVTSRIYFGAAMVNGVARKMIETVGLPEPERLSFGYEEYLTDEAADANTFVFKSTDPGELWTATFYVSDQ